ncbi:PAS domain S-box-containing protein [Alteromonadaceae bacterium Bs31]|nr:PAS domain S-box-containing protein [Alteromonadaceae bacterium Bs31]
MGAIVSETITGGVLLENFPEATILIDPISDRIAEANKLARSMLQLDDDLSIPASAYFHQCLPQLICFTQAVIEHKSDLTDELVFSLADGRELHLEVSASLLPSAHLSTKPEQQLICFCLRDKKYIEQWRVHSNTQRSHRHGLLEWQRIHQVFENIEKENQLILSAAGEGIYGIDADGYATFVNPAAERMLGWKAEELIGVNIHTAIHYSHADGSDYCVHDCPIYAAFKDGLVKRVEGEVFWTKGGKSITVDYTSTPILDNGHLVGAVVIFRDVTDRENAERKLLKALAEVERLKQKLELENAYLQEEISEGYNSHHIVGKSPAVRQVINQVHLVAPTDATVLITGESGTGKELIARAIHNAGNRNTRPLVRVNCAAIPRDLFESEFFGHVKGAYSGAVSDRLGRFEVADGGTLFLDEVGELPLELQGKLLRVLQDSEFERVGESRTRTVDVRVIAATNKNLGELVRQGLFREDLYFRLNVFPVHSAPLRERHADIPLLVGHFLRKACKRFNKPELEISVGQMKGLQNYSWPGNIRELQNLLERQVILSQGKKLSLGDLSDVACEDDSAVNTVAADLLTEQDCHKLQVQTIINALRQSGGKVYGDAGAAALLGIKPTTLASRIKKYGIDKTKQGLQ